MAGAIVLTEFLLVSMLPCLSSSLFVWICFFVSIFARKKDYGALFRHRTIPTERTPLVGEVSANFSG
jgi:hypothetical protein